MAINTTYAYGPQTRQFSPGHSVYVRENWFGEWVKVPYLFVDSCTWSLAPDVGQATLTFDYGRGMRQGETKPGIVARLAGRERYFVKIEFPLEAGTLRWFGTWEATADEQAGLLIEGKTAIPTARQRITCFSLERLLYQTAIRKSVWRNTATGAEKTIERVLTFNRPDGLGTVQGNRSAARGLRSFLFSDVLAIADQPWSSRNIAEYAITQLAPKGWNDIAQPYWRIDVDARDLVPDWDQPVIDPTGQTVGELLDAVLPRGRMLSWRIAVDDSLEGDISPHLKLHPVSLLGENISIGAKTLRQNPRRLWVKFDGLPDFRHAYKESASLRFDQVRLRGAQRTSTCTMSFADATLEAGWPTALETEYEAGFSGDPGYAALDTVDKQKRNIEVRHRDKLWPVFRRFAIPATWNFRVKDGLGGASDHPVFPETPGGDQVYPICPRELAILPTLPMLEGYDYETLGSLTVPVPPTRVSNGPHERIPPLVLFKSPVVERYFHVEKIGDGAGLETTDAAGELQFSCRVEVPATDRAILLHVDRRPQHAIAAADFDPLDVDPYAGAWDWQDALFTVALPDDRHCEGRYPTDALAKLDVIGCRRDLDLDAGDRYRLDYLVRETVIGVEADGTLIRAAANAWLRDDRPVLEARARQAYEYYRQQRRAVAFQTPRLAAALDLRLGDYVEQIGLANPETVGSVISQVQITVPNGDGPLMLDILTAFAQLDPQTFLV